MDLLLTLWQTIVSQRSFSNEHLETCPSKLLSVSPRAVLLAHLIIGFFTNCVPLLGDGQKLIGLKSNDLNWKHQLGSRESPLVFSFDPLSVQIKSFFLVWNAWCELLVTQRSICLTLAVFSHQYIQSVDVRKGIPFVLTVSNGSTRLTTIPIRTKRYCSTQTKTDAGK